ncbi:cation transporter [Shewanella sp. AS16]|uniref:cation transporter n=1 Tax=Shewanella sp. AS16 TaxID=2907625 RepID=UPI001F390BF2|nr:cation transporter [Shewanella sp. AS16]MCE9687301.1 cation transporter [Shewanella sp. AS16]
MSDLDHRAGVKEASLVVRHLKLEGMTESNKAEVIAAVDQSFGIDSVSYDEKSNILNLAYDATHCDLDGIEDILKTHDVYVAHDWWTHFKEGYYRFVDQNVKDNAVREPWSCHKPPSGSGKKR